jgi:tetratricopeptide (TPR) repeat protein
MHTRTVISWSLVATAIVVATLGLLRGRVHDKDVSTQGDSGGKLPICSPMLCALSGTIDIKPLDHRAFDIAHIIRLSRQAEAMSIAYRWIGSSALLLAAIVKYRCALQRSAKIGLNTNVARMHAGLGRCLVYEYLRIGRLSVLHEAIHWLELALQMTPLGHLDHIERNIDLADALSQRYEYTETRTDIDRALELLHIASSVSDHPLHPLGVARLTLAQVGATLLNKSQQYDAEHISRLVAALEEGVTSRWSANRAIVLAALARAHLYQRHMAYDLTAVFPALRRAHDALHCHSLAFIDRWWVHRLLSSLYGMKLQDPKLSLSSDFAAGYHHTSAGLDTIPHNPVIRSLLLQSLSYLYAHVPEDEHGQADVEKRLDVVEEACKLLPADHRASKALRSTMMAAFGGHYEYTGSVSSLDRIIALDQPELDLTFPILLFNVGMAMYDRVNAFRERNMLPLLDRGYHLLLACHSELESSSPERVRPLLIMVRIRQLQYEMGATDLDSRTIIDLSRQLVDYHENMDIKDRLLALKDYTNLCISHSIASQSLSGIDEADRIIAMGLELAREFPNPPKDFEVCRARASFARFRLTTTGSTAVEAWALYSSLASDTNARPRDRFLTTLQWISDARMAKDHSQEIAAYRRAISLLPLLGYIGQDAVTRREALAHARGLACSAATCALDANETPAAIEFIEEGRGIFWRQLLKLQFDRDSAPPGQASRIE